MFNLKLAIKVILVSILITLGIVVGAYYFDKPAADVYNDIPTEESGVQAAENIYVAKVIRETDDGFKEVEIILNIKGYMPDKTKIRGKDLKEGITYLLLTRTSDYTREPSVISYSFIISENQSLSKQQLLDLAKSNPDVVRYQELYQKTLTRPQSKIFEVRSSHAQLAADYGNNRILMGAAHNVFVGKVIKRLGMQESKTHYEVEVIDNIKGSLEGMVNLVQDGGLKDGILYIMNEDLLYPGGTNDYSDYLFQEGRTYLFATRYEPSKDYYNVAPHPNGRKTISTNSKLSKLQLKELSENDNKFKELEEAYKNEILLDADIYHNNTRNSYKSLHPDPETPVEPNE